MKEPVNDLLKKVRQCIVDHKLDHTNFHDGVFCKCGKFSSARGEGTSEKHAAHVTYELMELGLLAQDTMTLIHLDDAIEDGPACGAGVGYVTRRVEDVTCDKCNAALNRYTKSTLKLQAHSRACGWKPHEHGTACSSNCPTCGGKKVM